MTNDELAAGVRAVLEERFPKGPVSLVSLGNRGTSRLFRAETCEGDWFVKYPDECSRMYSLLSAAGGRCKHLAESAFSAPVPLAGGFVSCVRFRPSAQVPPERWTDGQLDSFVQAYRSLAAAMAKTADTGPMEDDAAFFAEITGYASRHPSSRFLLRPLLEIPPEERTYPAGASLVVTHGDLHSANYGFDGGGFAMFYDLDNILPGFVGDDLAYTVLDRAQRASVGRRGFVRCAEVLRRFVAEFGGSASEWRIAINRKRIRQAASKLSRRPDSLISAVDVFRHDRRAVRLMRSAGLM